MHHIAAFNRAPAPLLTIEDFRALDASMKDTTSTSSSGLDASAQDQPHKTVVQRFLVSRVLALTDVERPKIGAELFSFEIRESSSTLRVCSDPRG